MRVEKQCLNSCLTKKQNDEHGTVIGWLRTRLSMKITRASVLCLRGLRIPLIAYQTDDLHLENVNCRVF